MIKIKFNFFLVQLLLMMTLITGNSYAENKFIIKVSGAQQALPLDHSYGKFLKDRYDIDHLYLSGSTFSLKYRLPNSKDFFIGLETGTFTGSFKYKDLNGTTRENDLELEQAAFNLTYILNENFNLSGGIGGNKMTRKFWGYKSQGIVTSNVSENEGKVKTSTTGGLAYGELEFTLGDLRKDRFSIGAGYRYTHSVHDINSDDDRPAVNDKGIPKNSQFQVGGHAAHLSIAVGF